MKPKMHADCCKGGIGDHSTLWTGQSEPDVYTPLPLAFNSVKVPGEASGYASKIKETVTTA